MTTPYHAKYWATALTLREAPDSASGLTRAIGNARVDLNPHQVDAALFALQSPFAQGVLLADEVGLGKTIEASLIVAQRWAEGRRRILIVVPASLRKQWQQELLEKFFLPAVVLDGSSFRDLEPGATPLERDAVVVVSYQLVSSRQAEVARVPWDLVVLDEAHRLRNVYQTGAKTARAVAAAIDGRPRILLTATPLQNSLLELYGLVSIADPRVFGDLGSFREQFIRGLDEEARNRTLRQRLSTVCHRTLRRQVLEYVRFTQRIPITQEFRPSDAEQSLYDTVSAYLQRTTSFALPNQQRTLMTMILRKLLASSSFAIAGTLRALMDRLQGIAGDAAAAIGADFEQLDEVADEWNNDGAGEETAQREDAARLKEEIAVLAEALKMADGISENAKGQALIRALGIAFERTAEFGAARKAVIFTESRRTQDYLFKLLSANGYAGRIIMLNGGNTDPTSKGIYKAWLERHSRDGLPTGMRAVDAKAAIVEAFRDEAEILVATEAAAEGVNLQFCSLVVNYDLPWNPQRVEQRIGRCHRYGQLHDVVVVNFINQRNAADQRVFQLLAEKFRLFDGVFGASDDILGAVDSGIDIEKRIAQVYQQCRTREEITAAFDKLQAELDEQIRIRMRDTRAAVLDNFDVEVHDRLRVHRDRAVESLDEHGRFLVGITRHELGGAASFEEEAPRFRYAGDLAQEATYNLDWRDADRQKDVFYRAEHPLALEVIRRAQERATPTVRLRIRYRDHGARIASLEPWLGKTGWLAAAVVNVKAILAEQFLVLVGRTEQGDLCDDEQARRLLTLPAEVVGDAVGAAPTFEELESGVVAGCVKRVEDRNAQHFDAEVGKLDHWSDDLKIGLEREIKEFDQAIREAKAGARQAASLEARIAAQRQIRDLEGKRRQKRADLFTEQDKIDAQRDGIIDGLEKLMVVRHEVLPLYTIQWELA